MDDDTIEVRIYDQSHTKVFQIDARIKNKRAIKELVSILHQKGISLQRKKKDIDFF